MEWEDFSAEEFQYILKEYLETGEILISPNHAANLPQIAAHRLMSELKQLVARIADDTVGKESTR